MKIPIPNILLLLLMPLSAGMASALRPTISLADERPTISPKAMAPTAFGDWQEQPNLSAMIVDPTQQQVLDKIYSETLSRTYVNKAGCRIMLSVAYGNNQSDALQLHKPEVCYPSQGFTLLAIQTGTLNLLGQPIKATRPSTNLGTRFEPITYWTVVGDYVTTGGIQKKLVEMRYAPSGQIPDGMLVRVSSIDTGIENAYSIQNKFAAQLVQSIAPELRNLFSGNPTLN